MIVSDKGGVDFEPPPSGSHIARCVQVVDLGTQHWQWNGQPKTTHKVRLTFELPELLKVFDEAKGEEPMFVSIEYTASLAQKANLRRDLESWRGEPFTPEELEGFNLSKVLGAPALVNIVHETSRATQKKYAAIKGIMKLPARMKCPKQISPSVSFELDKFNQETFDSLPEWMQKKIADSDEYRALCESDDAPSGDGTDPAPDDDDIPF